MKVNNDYDALMEQLKIVKDRIRGVFHRENTGLYLHGRPGTSKSFTVCETLDNLGADYTPHSGHLTEIGLFDLIEENNSRILVLDDVSSIFNKPTALQILVAALGNPYDRSKTRFVHYKTAKEDKKIAFTGGVIAFSNLRLDGHHDYVLAAIRDRVNVIHHDPTDEQIVALILHIAESGVERVNPVDALMVATYLIKQCKELNVRPSVRTFVDKALADFRLWAAKKTESHWQDLVLSGLRESLIELKHPSTDLSRAERTEAERRTALEICRIYRTRTERIQAWSERTGLSAATFYRHFNHLKKNGLLPVPKVRDLSKAIA